MTISDDEFEVIPLTRAPGGQHVGICSGVRVVHTITGLSAECEYERSQHKNRKIARAMVEMGLVEIGYVKQPID